MLIMGYLKIFLLPLNMNKIKILSVEIITVTNSYNTLNIKSK